MRANQKRASENQRERGNIVVTIVQRRPPICFLSIFITYYKFVDIFHCGFDSIERYIAQMQIFKLISFNIQNKNHT